MLLSCEEKHEIPSLDKDACIEYKLLPHDQVVVYFVLSTTQLERYV